LFAWLLLGVVQEMDQQLTLRADEPPGALVSWVS
jgi:hypothetical protein